MPRMDGTGPMGLGPMTGRGLGPCGNGGRNGFAGRGFGGGRGRGFGMGLGLGARNFFGSSKDQLRALENQEKLIAEKLEAIKAEKKALKEEK